MNVGGKVKKLKQKMKNFLAAIVVAVIVRKSGGVGRWI